MSKSHKTPAKKKPATKASAKKPVKAPATKAKPATKLAKQPAKTSVKYPAKSAAKALVTSTKKSAAAPVKGKQPMSAADLKRMILERKTKAIAFSLDEVREIAKKNENHVDSPAKLGKNGKPTNGTKATDVAAKIEKPHKPHHVKAASLADILGFNPKKGSQRTAMIPEADVPDKYRRYYRLLLELRRHVLTQLGEHTEETLLKSAKDDSGDLSGYGQHMADAGTDTFDRDFALSLVSSEQEALAEIEAAIKRVHAGIYGICELTAKPIAKERLLAVPFTRYSAEAKKQVERHSHRAQQRGGLFGDSTEEDGGPKIADAESSDE